jgi:alkyl hydroperoxide reductase subunit AhpC
MNAQVLGVSVDSQYAHLQWTRQPRNEGKLLCTLCMAVDALVLHNVLLLLAYVCNAPATH